MAKQQEKSAVKTFRSVRDTQKCLETPTEAEWSRSTGTLTLLPDFPTLLYIYRVVGDDQGLVRCCESPHRWNWSLPK